MVEQVEKWTQDNQNKNIVIGFSDFVFYIYSYSFIKTVRTLLSSRHHSKHKGKLRGLIQNTQPPHNNNIQKYLCIFIYSPVQILISYTSWLVKKTCFLYVHIRTTCNIFLYQRSFS